MQIVSQGRDSVMPFNGARLSMKNAYATQIIALMPDRQGKVMAEYETYDRAKAVLEEIINNEATGEKRVYYLPQK